MELFKLYIRQKRKGIAVFFLFCGVFALSFLLYHLPLGAVLYPMLLCALLGAVFLAVDFAGIRKKHLQLSEIKKLQAAMISSLPKSESVWERDYQEIIASLKAEMAEVETASASRYQNMMDYYTVWVHQIKTPIAAMKLNLQNEDTPFSRKLSSDLFRIEQYAEMVLAYLRVDSASSDFVFKEYALDVIVRQCVRKFASEFITRKIHLDYQTIMETVITDEKWLSFVLEQLLSNALKYTGEGGSIRIYMTAPKTLCVEDTGIGIVPEDLPRIFEKGYTGYNGRKDQRASGIGLYLCSRICKKLGVELTAASEPDVGTVMKINLEEYQWKVE